MNCRAVPLFAQGNLFAHKKIKRWISTNKKLKLVLPDSAFRKVPCLLCMLWPYKCHSLSVSCLSGGARSGLGNRCSCADTFERGILATQEKKKNHACSGKSLPTIHHGVNTIGLPIRM